MSRRQRGNAEATFLTRLQVLLHEPGRVPSAEEVGEVERLHKVLEMRRSLSRARTTRLLLFFAGLVILTVCVLAVAKVKSLDVRALLSGTKLTLVPGTHTVVTVERTIASLSAAGLVTVGGNAAPLLGPMPRRGPLVLVLAPLRGARLRLEQVVLPAGSRVALWRAGGCLNVRITPPIDTGDSILVRANASGRVGVTLRGKRDTLEIPAVLPREFLLMGYRLPVDLCFESLEAARPLVLTTHVRDLSFADTISLAEGSLEQWISTSRLASASIKILALSEAPLTAEEGDMVRLEGPDLEVGLIISRSDTFQVAAKGVVRTLTLGPLQSARPWRPSILKVIYAQYHGFELWGILGLIITGVVWLIRFMGSL